MERIVKRSGSRQGAGDQANAKYNEQERERIGHRFADLRKHVEWTDEQGIHRIGMTQTELAERCGYAQSHIARIEQGRYSVGFDTLQAIAEAMGGKIDIIINNKTEEL